MAFTNNPCNLEIIQVVFLFNFLTFLYDWLNLMTRWITLDILGANSVIALARLDAVVWLHDTFKILILIILFWNDLYLIIIFIIAWTDVYIAVLKVAVLDYDVLHNLLL